MAKPIICKKCGTVYSSAQTICPKCMTRRPLSTEKIIGGIAICAFILILIGSLANVFEEDTSNIVSEENASRVVIDENKNKNLKVGDTLDANGLKITLNEAADWNGNHSRYSQPKNGYKYIRVYFIIKNTNSSDRYLSSYDFTFYADDAKMEEYIWGDNTLESGKISNGRNIQGYVYFEVPKNAQKIEIEYETDWWTDEKACFKVK